VCNVSSKEVPRERKPVVVVIMMGKHYIRCGVKNPTLKIMMKEIGW
jgi:hypothetical protein